MEQQAQSSGNEKPIFVLDCPIAAPKKEIEMRFFDHNRTLKAPNANQVPRL